MPSLRYPAPHVQLRLVWDSKVPIKGLFYEYKLSAKIEGYSPYLASEIAHSGQGGIRGKAPHPYVKN